MCVWVVLGYKMNMYVRSREDISHSIKPHGISVSEMHFISFLYFPKKVINLPVQSINQSINLSNQSILNNYIYLNCDLYLEILKNILKPMNSFRGLEVK